MRSARQPSINFLPMGDEEKDDPVYGGVHIINKAIVPQSITIEMGLSHKFFGGDGKRIAPDEINHG